MDNLSQEEPSPKKSKLDGKSKGKKLKKHTKSQKTSVDNEESAPVSKNSFEKPLKPPKKNGTVNPKFGKDKLQKGGKYNSGKKSSKQLAEKPEDWNEFKKKKKELKLKRKQNRGGFEIVGQAKALVDKIRRKTLSSQERNKLVNQLHVLLKGQYARFALAHDSSRLVQCALKYGSNIMRGEISKELMGIVVEMMTSKYGKHIVQRMLKHGEPHVRASVINAMYGNAVKLASHVISSPILEYAYSTWATPLQKHHLLQEFFSDMYKKSKDDKVKCLQDVYETSPDLKSAVLGAVKENLSRIMNKNLLDSGLVQSLLSQYLSECKSEHKAELISQICPHIVVVSNSKDGSRAAMQCIWSGSNKDRKVAMKVMKEHIIEMCKHEHGHCSIIALLDSADDTVLLHKILLGEILKHACELATDEYGRKVLLWLVAPADSTYFHPSFIKELETGRSNSTSKKDPKIRREELLQYAGGPLLDLVKNDPEFWLSKASLAVEMLSILKAGEVVQEGYAAISEIITNPEWKVENIPGIEHAGVHMALKKLAQYDKTRIENDDVTFGSCLSEKLSKETVAAWIKCNRGCFLLVTVFENSDEEVKTMLKKKLQKHLKRLKGEGSSGAKILVKKMTE